MLARLSWHSCGIFLKQTKVCLGHVPVVQKCPQSTKQRQCSVVITSLWCEYTKLAKLKFNRKLISDCYKNRFQYMAYLYFQKLNKILKSHPKNSILSNSLVFTSLCLLKVVTEKMKTMNVKPIVMMFTNLTLNHNYW